MVDGTMEAILLDGLEVPTTRLELFTIKIKTLDFLTFFCFYVNYIVKGTKNMI